MSNWFECKVKYYKLNESSGKVKKVLEHYVFDAFSFTDAEARIIEEVQKFVRDVFVVTNISKAKYTDVFQFDDANDWYKVKVTYTDIDQKTGREKKFSNMMLVTAHSVDEASGRIDESLQGWIVDHKIESITLTKISDVIPMRIKESEA